MSGWDSGEILHRVCRCRFTIGTSPESISYFKCLTKAFSEDWLYSNLKLTDNEDRTPIEVAKHHDVAIYLTTFMTEYEIKQALSKHKSEIPDVTQKTKSKKLDVL